MRYYFIAGEASGDLHAANLVKALKSIDNNAVFGGWGGNLMSEQGVVLDKHYKDLAFMGFIEVLANIRTIKKNFKACKKNITEFNPDVVILVDYPGFNLRMAPFIKKSGITVLYYISPTVWAWHESRVKTIKKYVDRLFVILPFEKDFYKKFNYEVEFAGHPLLDAIHSYTPRFSSENGFRKAMQFDERPIIALLPGSRKQEVKYKLPLMLETSRYFPQFQFIIAGAPSLEKEFYNNIIGNEPVKIAFNQTYDILSYSYAALVTSGTATLETALFNVPQVVCYRTSPVSFAIAKKLVNVKFISLVNLILGKESIRELIQKDLTINNIVNELTKITLNEKSRASVLADYKLLNEVLGGPGASGRIASSIEQYLSENKNA